QTKKQRCHDEAISESMMSVTPSPRQAAWARVTVTATTTAPARHVAPFANALPTDFDSAQPTDFDGALSTDFDSALPTDFDGSADRLRQRSAGVARLLRPAARASQ